MNREQALAIRTSTLEKGTWEGQFEGQDDTDIRKFASQIMDLNPIHHDEEFAKTVVGLDAIVATGVRIMGFASSMVGNALPGGMIYKINEITFPKPLYAGVPVLVRCRIAHYRHPLVKVHVAVIIGDGNVGECTCTVALPR